MNRFKKGLTAIFLYGIMMLCIAFVGCSSEVKEIYNDTPTSGTINISADESFKPVIDEQVKVFEDSYPGTRIIVNYKPEAECLKDILKDSATRMVIVTRGLNRREEKFYKDSLNFTPRWDELATDAIAVIVNKGSQDTIFSIERLQAMLSGKAGKLQQVVFDGLSATSTVRFAIDSLLKGKSFDTGVVKAVRSSKEVLDYIAQNNNAVGFVGISWLGNPEDTAQLNMLKNVKMVGLRCNTCNDTPYVKPTQYSIMTRQYPLVRGLYYILKENYAGLGSGFLNFLQYERGQLIFRRAYLGPSKMGFAIRNVQINEKLQQDK